jgi:hypothetical protein
VAREDAIIKPERSRTGRRRNPEAAPARQQVGVLGWLVFAAVVGYLVAGPAGALVATMLFLPAVFGIRPR